MKRRRRRRNHSAGKIPTLQSHRIKSSVVPAQEHTCGSLEYNGGSKNEPTSKSHLNLYKVGDGHL